MESTDPFVIRLVTLPEAQSHQEMVGSAEELGVGDDQTRVRSPIVFRATFYRNGDRIEVQGVVSAAVEFDCVRCLVPVQARVQAPLRAYAERRESRDRRAEEEVREDDVGIVYHDGRSVDLTEEVRQVFLLELPWHGVCRSDCRGLCPRCGANRNLVSCDCEPEVIDSRWEALRKLTDPE